MRIEPRILVVEDDEVVGKFFEAMLPRWGYQSDVVFDAENALRLLAQKPYDLIIADIRLPGLDGVELLRRVKRRWPDLDVILMTAYADMQSILEAVEAGVYDYLIKPFDDIKQVVHKIERALEKHRILLENRRLIEYLRQANAQIESMNRGLEDQVVERTAQLEEVNLRLEQLTLTDDVTGLYNQRFLHTRLAEEYQRSVRYDHGLAILMLDLDYFKQANDTHDHLFGTRVLERVGRVLVTNLRSMDMVIRYGGDEFVVLLPHARLDRAVPVAERLRSELEAADCGDEGEYYRVTTSVGVAAIGDTAASTPEALLQAADKALYVAKETGRNRVAVMHGAHPVAVVA